MQATETGTIQTKNIKDEGSINFRPSPNFKHMKKYLKSKFEEDMSSSSSLDSKESEKEHKVLSAVQPPLPPNSPPPDSPLSFTLKKEVVDDEYEQNNSKSEDIAQEESAPLTHNGGAGEKKKAIMCKDFVRKTCTRGAACIYAHELDVSQLKGVYRFCRDFENSRCDRRVCYFVHATTFEKEHFFRTGDLPPHALAHLKPSPAAPAGTPAAPLAAAHPAATAEPQQDLSAIFSNPPPQPLPTGSVPVQPLISCVAAAAEPFPAPPPPAPAAPAAALAPSLALKREWRDIEDFSSSPRDLDSKEPLAKKCNHCEITELRLQRCKAQVETELVATQELDDRLELQIKKNNSLFAILQILLKPRRAFEFVNNNFRSSSRIAGRGSGGTINKDMMKILLTKILLSGGGGGGGLRAAADFGLPSAGRDRPT